MAFSRAWERVWPKNAFEIADIADETLLNVDNPSMPT
jgi:hypothetical protein